MWLRVIMKQLELIFDVDRCHNCPLLVRKWLFWWECTENGLTVSRRDLKGFPAYCDLEDVDNDSVK